MALLAPVALALLGLAGAIVALHLVGRRGRTTPVPSALFWRGLGQPTGGLTTARYRLTSLLLLLDLLAVALLTLALARPALPAGPARNVVVLVDASASMQATDVRPSRFAEARRQAREILSHLRAGDRATVVRVGTAATRLGSTDDGAAPSGLVGALAPGDGAADFSGAVALAAASLDPTRQNEVVVLSDGGSPAPEVGALPATVRYQPIGTSGDNQGITALAVQPRGLDDRPAAFARVANFAARPAEVPVRALADGVAFDARRLALPARGYADLILSPPSDARLLEVRLGREDILALDDRAYAVLATRAPVDVLLVSDAPFYLERALRLRPDVRLRVVPPAGYAPGAPADVVVLDRVLPDPLPAGNLLLVNPPLPVASDGARPPSAAAAEPRALGLVSRGEMLSPALAGVAADDPLLRGADLAGAVVRRAQRIGAPDWAQAVADASGGPLVLRGAVGSRRVVALAFALADSDLPLRPAFPVLISNAVDWLRPLAVPPATRPDSLVRLDVPGGWDQLQVRGPGGPLGLLRPLPSGPAILGLDDVGPYLVTARSPSGSQAEAALAVSLLDERESDVAPRADAPVRGAGATATPARGYDERWRPVALLAFLVLLAEWWWYHRGRGWTPRPGCTKAWSASGEAVDGFGERI